MRLDFHGRLADEPRIRAGFIGCGSHSFRNIYPVFQFTPVELVATCDLDLERATAFARQFGAERAYDDHHRMLSEERLDAVFIVVGFDAQARPLHARLAMDVLSTGRHAWIEKPPSASVAELEALRDVAAQHGRFVAVGLKKAFMPANRKAKELMNAEGFDPHLLMLQYPQHVPTVEEFEQYAAGEPNGAARSFLDHLCHPMSLIVELFGRPDRLWYTRTSHGACLATFTYADGRVASLAMTNGTAHNGGMERTTIIGRRGRHIVVENNQRVTLHRNPGPLAYGASPDYYVGDPGGTTAVWQPEFSLGQLYNKGLFLLGYYDEINDFARRVLSGEAPTSGGIRQAIDCTAVFEAFAEGPDRTIEIDG